MATIYRSSAHAGLLALRDCDVIFCDEIFGRELYATRADENGMCRVASRMRFNDEFVRSFTDWTSVGVAGLGHRLHMDFVCDQTTAIAVQRQDRADRADPDLKQLVYFAWADTTTLVKIGYTANIDRRLRSLQNGSATPLHLLELVQGGPLTEAAYHGLLDPHRAHGEWFEWSDKLFALIGALRGASVLEARHPDAQKIYDAMVRL